MGEKRLMKSAWNLEYEVVITDNDEKVYVDGIYHDLQDYENVSR